MKFNPPLGSGAGVGKRFNRTLHGRSVHRPSDVPGHNVFKGYNNPGHGDGIDLFAAGGTPVYAIDDCTQTRHSNDESRLEVIYLEGVLGDTAWVAVYAHINAKHNACNVSYKRGDVVGYVRKDLSDPHLHFELWLHDPKTGWAAVSGKTAVLYAQRLKELCGLAG